MLERIEVDLWRSHNKVNNIEIAKNTTAYNRSRVFVYFIHHMYTIGTMIIHLALLAKALQNHEIHQAVYACV